MPDRERFMNCLPIQDEDGSPLVYLRTLQDSTRPLNETKTMHGGIQYVAYACRFQYNDTSYMETVLQWQFAPECGHGPHPLPLPGCLAVPILLISVGGGEVRAVITFT